jgi:hypothetical protein
MVSFSPDLCIPTVCLGEANVCDRGRTQSPGFNGNQVEMSRSLCEEIIQYGMDICSSGTPARTQGFNAAHNGEWAFLLDVTNIDDDDAEGAYGG